MEQYLLSRREAAKRYGMSQDTFDKLYRRDPEFPVLRVGKRVLIPWKKADAYFAQRLREVIDTTE